MHKPNTYTQKSDTDTRQKAIGYRYGGYMYSALYRANVNNANMHMHAPTYAHTQQIYKHQIRTHVHDT